MKYTTVLLLPAVISAAVIDTRQTTAQYKFTTTSLTPKLRTTSKRTLTKIGPFKLQAGLSGRHGLSLDSNGQGVMFSVPQGTFCGGDCTIISGQTGFVLENGTTADVSTGVYIHHILSTNNKKKVEPFVSMCDTTGDVSSIRRPGLSTASFLGGSDDNVNEPMVYGTKDGSIEGGYWLSKEDSFGMWADLVNLDPREKNVYVTYDLEFLPGHVGTDAQGSLISVTGCTAKRIATPSNAPANTTSGKFRFFRDGYLVNGKGHLHDGGVAMDLFINDKYACSSNAVYGGGSGTTIQNGKKWETIAAMTMCPGPIKVKDGDYMSINARYDLTKYPLRENGDHKMAEVMGMWTMPFIAEKASAASASAAPVAPVIGAGAQEEED